MRHGVRVNRLSLRRGADGGGAEQGSGSKQAIGHEEFHRVHTAFHREKANGAARKVGFGQRTSRQRDDNRHGRPRRHGLGRRRRLRQRLGPPHRGVPWAPGRRSFAQKLSEGRRRARAVQRCTAYRAAQTIRIPRGAAWLSPKVSAFRPDWSPPEANRQTAAASAGHPVRNRGCGALDAAQEEFRTTGCGRPLVGSRTAIMGAKQLVMARAIYVRFYYVADIPTNGQLLGNITLNYMFNTTRAKSSVSNDTRQAHLLVCIGMDGPWRDVPKGTYTYNLSPACCIGYAF